MDICGHHIQCNHIIGIGPLYMQTHPDQHIAALYNSQRLVFTLHLRNHTTEIQSEYYKLFEKGQKEKFDAFINKYSEVAQQIKETVAKEDAVRQLTN